MEKRLLLASLLSVVLLVGWQVLFSPAPPPPAGPSGGSGVPAAPSPAARPAPPPSGASTLGVALPRLPGGTSAQPGAQAEVRTPLYHATFGPDGTVTAWALDYRGVKPLLVGGAPGPLAVAIMRAGQPTEVLRLAPGVERLALTPQQPTGALTFAGTARDGMRVEKTLHFSADSYRIELELRAEGGSGDPVTFLVVWTSPVALPGATREAPWLTFGEGPAQRQLMGRILLSRAGALEYFDAPGPALKDPKEAPQGPELKDPQLVPPAVVAAQRGWVALENDYFIAALISAEGVGLFRGRERDLAEVGLVFAETRLQAGQRWEGAATLYAGPKEWELLSAKGVGLEPAQARNYGTLLWTLPMEWFCVPLLWLMNFLARQVPGQNYGVAIILLTVLVKIAFYPLAHKSMSSMKQMQALQPQINALKAKYKSDSQRIQREQMELFRKHKVNPMGGCLPMVVQIPIFYALYLTLQFSVELQGAPFLLWITDLSKKDSWYVLPILMGVSMLVQQKMTPTVGDPRQARIMLIMPVIFTFMFLEFPTGLVLYWLVNNVLSIAQQYLIDRSAARAKVAAVLETKAERAPRRAPDS